MLSKYLLDIFTNMYEINDHNTREPKFNFTLPKPKTNYMKKAFAYRGTKVWNSLSIDLKSLGTITNFKSKIKQLKT